jgi:predicted RND superfamily exporter protein
MLTAITTAAGLTPLLLGSSIGAQFLQPTAVAVFYGLLFATFLTLGLLPAMLITSNHLKRGVMRLIRRQEPSKEAVEPAIIEKKQLERLKSI